MNNGNEGLENLKELEKLELIINKFKQLITEQESEIETLKKEIALVREDGQTEVLRLNKLLTEAIFTREQRIRELEQINKEHQDQNGKLRDEIKSIELGTVNNFRRKGVL
jgi:predicted  nucleic acid-binding Zn-ribbon protein